MTGRRTLLQEQRRARERTARRCMFCGADSATREHAVPAWLLDTLGSSAASLMEVQFREEAPRKPWFTKDGILINRFCASCQNGWMSDLEASARPTVGPLAHDLALWLSREQQALVARWSLKTAMVLEGVNAEGQWFYSGAERAGLMTPSAQLPEATYIWAGRYAHSGTSYFQSRRMSGDTSGLLSEGYAVTFGFGHLVLQTLTVRRRRQSKRASLEIKAGPWNDCLIQVWPVTTGSIRWPPPLSFSASSIDLDELSGRFRRG